MVEMKILIVISLILVSNCICQRFECDWSHEYLCGDKCIEVQRNSCTCGHETVSYLDLYYNDSTCCNEGTCIINHLSGDVICNGAIQNSAVPCNGSCKQSASGWTSVPCKDGKQCVWEVTLCRGDPNCNE